MAPTSAAAALFLLALVPGFFYLRRTSKVRQPSEATALQEALEVIAVGLMTTGATVAGCALVWGSKFVEAGQVKYSDSADLRVAVAVGIAVFGAACGLAELAAWARRGMASDRRYEPNVWMSVFGDIRPGQMRHVTFELSDGRTFDGPLHSYSILASDGGRQIALKGPIRLTRAGEAKPVPVAYTYVVVDVDQIRFAALSQVENPG